MVIVETPVFSRLVVELLSEESYRELQLILVARPDLGDVIPGGGGLRKVRWTAIGHGKRGGVRVIYYWYVSQDRILMLYVYPKNEISNLSDDQIRRLRKMVEEEL